MRIAFISTMAGFPWGGSEELWCRTAELALQEGHQVVVAVYKWPNVPIKIQELQVKGAKIYFRKRNSSEASILKRVFNRVRNYTVPNPFSHLLEFKPDVVCISQGQTFDIVRYPNLYSLLSKNTIPYVLISQHNEEHGILPAAILEIAQKVSAEAKGFVFVSERNREVAKRQLVSSLPNSKVICNPLNISDFSVVPWPTLSDPTLFSFANVARLDCNFKAQDVLLQVLADEKWLQRNWRLNLYGEGPDKGYLEKLIHFYGLRDKVFLVGHEKNIRKVWQNNMLFVLPSVSEGTPLSLMEAMICGRAAVVSDVGGNATFIKEGETGFLSSSFNYPYLTAALENAWNARHNWQQMGEKAHQHAHQIIDYTPEKTLLSYITS